MRKGTLRILSIVTALAVMLISVAPVNAATEETANGFAGADEMFTESTVSDPDAFIDIPEAEEAERTEEYSDGDTNPADTDPALEGPADTDPADTAPAATDPADTDPANEDPSFEDPTDEDPSAEIPAEDDMTEITDDGADDLWEDTGSTGTDDDVTKDTIGEETAPGDEETIDTVMTEEDVKGPSPDNAVESPFESFAIALDTTDSGTTKLSDGSYRKLSDSQDPILPVVTVRSGYEDVVGSLQVTFTSKKGTMNFGPAGIAADSSYTTTFSEWKEGFPHVKVVRNGCGRDEVIVTVTLPEGYEKSTEQATMVVIQEGWESFMGSSYSLWVVSGRYWQNGSFFTGWKSFRKDTDPENGFPDCYIPDDAGTWVTYFDPTTKTTPSGVTMIDGKLYYFVRTADGATPCFLKKADYDGEFVNVGTASVPQWICMNTDGSLYTGLLNKGIETFYFSPADGCEVTNDWVRVGEDVYYAGADGKLKADGKVSPLKGGVYILKDKRIMKGLGTDSQGRQYYCDPTSGAVTFGIIKLNKKKVLQTEDGIPKTAGFHYCAAIDQTLYTNNKGQIEGGKEVTLELGGEDKIYYVNPDGTMFAGLRKTGNKTYRYTEQGREEVGTVKLLDFATWDEHDPIGYGVQDQKGNLVFYKDESGTEVLKNTLGILYENGYPGVLINDKGRIVYGWYTMDGDKYYADKTTGCLINYSTGESALKEVEGKLYYFSASSYVECPETEAKRWVTLSGNDYYIGSSGRPVTGWQTIGGKKYYFDKSGALHKTAQIGKKYYVLRTDFSVVVPESEGVYDNEYILNRDGSIKAGWATVKTGGVTKRYYTPTVKPTSGFLKYTGAIYRIGGKYYAFASDGTRRTGWQKGFMCYSDGPTDEEFKNFGSPGIWFYFDPKSGAMVSGKKNIKDVNPETGKKGTFYFGDDFKFSGYIMPGGMITRAVIKSGKELKYIESGNAVSTSEFSNGLCEIPAMGKVYFVSKGKLVSGQRKANSDTYYFDAQTGEMVRDALMNIKGKWYYFGSDGKRVTSGVTAYVIRPDEDDAPAEAVFHTKGHITGFKSEGVTVKNSRIRIAGGIYLLNSKGAFAKGPYTFGSGAEAGTSYLSGSDYRIPARGLNTVIKYGKKYYVVDGEGHLLKNGLYTVGREWSKAYTKEQRAQMRQLSLSFWPDGHWFYTDRNGAIITNKTVTSPAGNKVYLNKYGLSAGPFFKKSGKWYCYDRSGILTPGVYAVSVKQYDTNTTVDAYITVGKNGKLTRGVRRKENGSVIKGLVFIDGKDDFGGVFCLDKKGMPSGGTKDTPKGKRTFNKVSGKITSDISD